MDAVTRRSQRFTGTRSATIVAVTAFAALRLCHIRLLWADEDYHIAAALNILHSKLPYRDFWYDKPPLNSLYYLLIGGYAGWPLRLLDTLYVLLVCSLAFRLARVWWGESEARVSAFLLAFFLTFYLPSAVIAFAADALMIAPHLAAIYYAFARRAFLAGFYCAVALLINPKALFVLAVCVVWLFPSLPLLSLGFALPLIAVGALAVLSGSWDGYIEQVWRWGWIYAAQSPVKNPLTTGLIRTLDWLGFHAVLAGGAAFGLYRVSRKDRWKLGSWLAISFAAVSLGTRFAPHYFLHLLPAMVIAASRGIVLAWREYRKPATAFFALALLVPIARFAPRYVSLAYDDLLGRTPRWTDVVMDLDSRAAAHKIRASAQPSDTLFVWGYRPDIYVYTRLTSDGKFWDSQPLTGVPADRHLHMKDPIYGGPAAQNRQVLVKTRPTWVVDGLGPLNPNLKPEVYPDLRLWLENYKIVGRTKLSVIYRRLEP